MSARPLQDDFARILVICTRQIGDVLLTTPLIHAARLRWPSAAIDVLGFAGTLGMLRGNDDVRALVEVEADSGWRGAWRVLRRIWRRYDLALIAQYSDRAHLYGWAAARRRSGQVFAGAKSWWKRALLDHAVLLDDVHEHAVTEKLRLLAPWGLPAEATFVAPRAEALPDAIAAALEDRYAVLHVPSLVRYKQWPLEHYATLARSLVDRGLQVVLSGGPGEDDRTACADVTARVASPRVLDVSGRLDLGQMASLLARAAVYVGPDTSITHLAAACGTPVAALYGPISPRLWGPSSGGPLTSSPWLDRAERQRVGKVIVIQGRAPCVPCNRAGCEDRRDSRSACLEGLAPARVEAAVLELVGEGEEPR